VALQRRLAAEVRVAPLPAPPELLAGVDCAFAAGGRQIVAAAVLWRPRARGGERRSGGEPGEVVAEALRVESVPFPYVPGLLSFRELPALVRALGDLPERPDLVLCDGQGLAHPRRFGIACHLGVFCDLPAVGCGKTRLVGEAREPGPERGARSPITDPATGERLGTLLRTRTAVRPLWVSVGHRVTLEDAEDAVLAGACRYRLPEPVHRADRRSRQEARRLDRSGTGGGP
jgi:deoxyribonuclease V